LTVSKGASAIDKHFKLDEKDCGPDASFSILPEQLKGLCKDCGDAFEAIKSNQLRRESSELVNKKFRRSLYFVNDLSKGEIISKDDIMRV
jgi:N-acetylneuraminate synthase